MISAERHSAPLRASLRTIAPGRIAGPLLGRLRVYPKSCAEVVNVGLPARTGSASFLGSSPQTRLS